MDKSKLSMPIAIVIAGVVIAGAIVYTSKNNQVASTAGTTKQSHDVVLSDVSSNDHIKGRMDAPVALVEYSDLECPFCKQFHNVTLDPIMTPYLDAGSVSWVYRHFPLNRHPKAPKEAEASECAAELGGGNDMFWKFADKVFATTNSNNSLDIGVYNTPATAPVDPSTNKPYYIQKTPTSKTDAGQLTTIATSLGIDKTTFEQCLASGKYTQKVTDQMNEGIKAGGDGTPFTVFILKNKIGSEAAKFVSDKNAEILAQINQPGTPDLMYVSSDGKKVAMSGAMPVDIVKGLLDKLVANK